MQLNKISLLPILACLSTGLSDSVSAGVSKGASDETLSQITMRLSENYGVVTESYLTDGTTVTQSKSLPTNERQKAKAPFTDALASQNVITNEVSACPATTRYSGYIGRAAVWLRNQDEVDALLETYSDCTAITNVFIGNPTVPGQNFAPPERWFEPVITNLQGLSNIVTADELVIYGTNLETLAGLENLNSVSETLQITSNPDLVSAAGLESLNSIGALSIGGNEALVELPDYSERTMTLDYLLLSGNSALADCSNIATLVGFPDRWPFETMRYGWFIERNGDGCNSAADILSSVDPNFVSDLGYEEPIFCSDEIISVGSQAEIDALREAYGEECNAIDLMLVSGSDITNLDGLAGMRYISELSISNTSLSDTSGLNTVWVLGRLKGINFPAMPNLVKTGMRYGIGKISFSVSLINRPSVLYDSEKFPKLRVVHAPLHVTDASTLGAATLAETCELQVSDVNSTNLNFLSNLRNIACPFSIEPTFAVKDSPELTEASLPSLNYDGTILFDLSFENNASLTSIEFRPSQEAVKSSFGLEISKNSALETITLPDGLVSLSILDQSSIYDAPDLPSSLTALRLSETKISELPVLPNTLETLNLNANEIRVLPSLPQRLKNLTLSSTQISAVPELPWALSTVSLSGNTDITELNFNSDSSSLQELTLSETPISSFSGTENITSISLATLGAGIEIGEEVFPNAAITYELNLSGDVKFKGFNFQTPPNSYSHALNTLNLSVGADADISGLESLITVRYLNVVESELSNLSALESLTGASVVKIINNAFLTDISALADIEHTTSWSSRNPPVFVESNPLLLDVELGRFYATLMEAIEVRGGVEQYGYVSAVIAGNDALEKLSVFEQTTAATNITISNNSALRDLNSLRGISKASSLSVRNNASLSDCGGAWLLLGFPSYPHDTQNDNVYGYVRIADNAEGAMSPDDCLEPLVAPDADPDRDGFPNEQDAFPADALEWADTDGDGVGNNADTDDDDDGYSDDVELAMGSDPLDPNSVPEDVSSGLPIWLKYWVSKP